MNRSGTTDTVWEEAGMVVDIIHSDSDAGMWIVRRRKKFLWMKRLVSRDWFNSELQALEFARGLKSG